MSGPDIRPPSLAASLLRLSLPEGMLRDAILGDFTEEYHRRARDGSIARATLWYWRHALDLAARSFIGRLMTRDRYWASGMQRSDTVASTPATSDGGQHAGGHASSGAGNGPESGQRHGFRPGPMVDTLVQDLRYGLRQIIRRPGFSALVALTLAVGIGGNVAIFSVLKGVVLRELPYPEAHRLVAVWETPEAWLNYQPWSGPDYLDVRQQSTKFEEFGVTIVRWFNLAGGVEPVRVRGGACTASLFRLLGVSPAQGRFFTDDEETEGNDKVLVLSHGFWQRHFGGASDVVGRDVVVDGEPYEVVGIMPAHFEFPTPWGGRDNRELWAPLIVRDDRSMHSYGGIARLAEGVTMEEAAAELEGIAAQLAEAYPDTNGHTGMRIEPMMRRTLGGIATALVFLLIIVGLVLLIACANVASMLLARGTHRLPELAVRASMGAGRRRLVRQLMTESLVLSLLGGIAGVLVAFWSVGALRGILPDNVPRVTGIAVDTTVLTFAAVITVATGLLFGLAPALFAARSDLSAALKEGLIGSRSGSGSKPLSFLIAAQLAIGLVLVNVAVVLLVSYSNVMHQEYSFDIEEVVVAGVSLVGPAYGEPHQRRAFWDDVLRRIRNLPDVVEASLTNKLPLNGGSNSGVLVNDDVFDPLQKSNLVEYSFIANGYHEAMGITLLGGRTFTEVDLEAAAAALAANAGVEDPTIEVPIVINRRMAEDFWPEESALGKIVRPDSAREYFRGHVVGVVENTRQWGATYRPLPEMYFPHTGEVWPPPGNRLLIVRTEGDSEALAATIRAAVLEVNDQIPVSAPYTMAEVLHQSTGRRRFSMTLVGLFAVTALVLIIAGTYGVMSFAVSQRIHEIGVRVALGADKTGVLRLFAYRAARMLLPGLLVGLGLTVAVSVITNSMVFGISALNPLYVLAAMAVMLVVTALATVVPVARAMRVDPVEALRAE